MIENGPEPEAVRTPRVEPALPSRPAPCASRRGARGMTLAEILVALAFMGVVTVGITALAIAIVNGNAKSRAITIAVHLAQERLEAIRNTPYASIPTSYADDFPQSGFRRSTAVTENLPIAGVKRIVVTVSGGGATAQEEMLVSQ